jgi:hypothetical protein
MKKKNRPCGFDNPGKKLLSDGIEKPNFKSIQMEHLFIPFNLNRSL